MGGGSRGGGGQGRSSVAEYYSTRMKNLRKGRCIRMKEGRKKDRENEKERKLTKEAGT